MTQLKTVAFSLGFCLALGSVTTPAFAIYHAETAVVKNSFTIPSSTTRITIHFSSNGGSGSMADQSVIVQKGNYISECTMLRDGYRFTGWNTKADGSGISLSDEADVNTLNGNAGSITLYAQWAKEGGTIPEPVWNSRLNKDHNHNNVADRLELRPGSTFSKDPSLKNTTSKTVYGYLLVAIPTANLSISGSNASVADIATITKNAHWTLIHSSVSSSSAKKSKYLYRYDTTLSPSGSSAQNPYLSARKADQSTDLFNNFQIKTFTNQLSLSSSIDITGAFVESTVTQSLADSLAIQGLTAKGLL